MKFLIFLLLVFLMVSQPKVNGQEIIEEEVPCNKLKMNVGCDKGWFTMGVGSESNGLLHGYVRASFGRDFPYQFTMASSSSILGGKQLNYVSFSKGISMVDNVGRLSIFGGPSIIWGNDNNPEPGISANAQVNIAPLIPIGLGLDLYGNFSPSHFMYGIGFSFVIEGHK